MDSKTRLFVFSVSLIAISLAGCDVSQDMAVEKGKEMVASALKDPASATFGRVFMVENQTIGDSHYGLLCGEVNSKNSFGGFTGFRRFVANFSYSKRGALEVSYVTLEEGDRAAFNRAGISYFQDVYWDGKCEPRAQPPATAKTEVQTPLVPVNPAPPPTKAAHPVKSRTPSPPLEASVPTAPSEKKISGWSVQVASVADRRKATSIRDQLDSSGSLAYVTSAAGVYRVFSGPYETRALAEAALASLMRTQQLRGIVVRAGD
ncbi:SPOR domain-containing protein [Pseudomonas graminis]|uniref:Cell division protein FtsN n=1 Tax=Pseudomonas graminis TaxID=158627 RepID=A0A6M8MSS8_9PSED|nr:SPOR domain-containing protein [Pseudomonas graminis]QKF52791.1 Cell division protein FtsN [Pseudomonas graminis]